jgi:hypothetical protein
MGKLPFVGRIFWKTLAFVVVVAAVAIWAYIKFAEYEVTSADRFGAPVTVVLLSYLIHLWLLPADVLQGDDDAEHPENHSDEA